MPVVNRMLREVVDSVVKIVRTRTPITIGACKRKRHLGVGQRTCIGATVAVYDKPEGAKGPVRGADQPRR